ncbi:MAG: biopolymer transporter ExbD [Pseudomonadota bacterium]
MGKIQRRRKSEPTIALINIVFLMLVFFLVAGTLAQPIDGQLQLVETSELKGRAPPDALIIHQDGQLSYRGQRLLDVAAFTAERDAEQLAKVRVVPDRELDANRLVEISRALRAEGSGSVVIVTEQALR